MQPSTVQVSLRPSPEEAVDAYRALVLANREQMDRIDGERPANDHWAQRAPNFRPGRMDAPEVTQLLTLAQPGDVWLDVGAGAGRYAIPLSRKVARVIAVEPSPAMRAQLALAASEAGRLNIDPVAMEWPPRQSEVVTLADASLVANVLYGVAEIGDFLTALESFTRRACVVLTFDRAPNTPLPEVWEAIHAEPFNELPALRELIAVLSAKGRRFAVHPVTPPAPLERALADVLPEARRVYHVSPGSPGDTTLQEILLSRFQTRSGMVLLPALRQYSALVDWPV